MDGDEGGALLDSRTRCAADACPHLPQARGLGCEPYMRNRAATTNRPLASAHRTHTTTPISPQHCRAGTADRPLDSAGRSCPAAPWPLLHAHAIPSAMASRSFADPSRKINLGCSARRQPKLQGAFIAAPGCLWHFC